MEDQPEKDKDGPEKDVEPPEKLDKEHGEEVPKNLEGNVAKLVERGRQMGF